MKNHNLSWIIVILLNLILANVLPGCSTTYNNQERAEIHFKQGILFAKSSDFENAVFEFQKAIEISPTSKAYANLGVCYMRIGKTNKALEALQQAVSIDKSDSYALYNLTAIYSVQDKTDLALDSLDKALKYGFNNYDAIRFDKDLDNLRAEPEFRKILEKHKVFLQ